jgi:hypothetical protein
MLKKAISMAITMGIGLGSAAVAEEPQSPTTGKQEGSLFEPHFGKDFSASVGVKAWISQWTLPLYHVRENQSDQELVQSYVSKTEIPIVPVISFRYKNFFVSGSYFPKTDYSFGEQFIDLPVEGSETKVLKELSGSAERSEWDINVGYYLLPSLVVTAGYKKINRDYRWVVSPENADIVTRDARDDDDAVPIADNITSILTFEGTFEANDDIDGLTLGIAGVAPLQGRLGLYGNFAFGWLETYSSSGATYDADYYLGDLGLLYSSRLDNIRMLEAASVYLGYRFQTFTEDVPIGEGTTDTTKGFVFGVNFVF